MSQKNEILDYLQTHEEGITPADAMRLFGCMRLAARIADLRLAGYSIIAENERHDGGNHARYKLETEEKKKIRSMQDGAKFIESAHFRFKHRKVIPGCEYC